MDVEDVQTPYLTVINCSSADENLGIASRAYRLRTEGCHAPVCVYGGWRAEVYDHVGRVCHARDDCPTGIYVEHSVIKDMWAAHIGPDYVLKDCSVELCSALNRIGNFTCVIGDDYVRSVCVYLNGVVRGTILGKDGWFELGPQQGSSLRIRLEEDQDLWIRAAVSDSWGLDSNILVLPAGHTVHDSTFVLGAPMMYAPSGAAAARAAFGGAYEDYRFEVAVDEPFTARALWFDAPIELRFIR